MKIIFFLLALTTFGCYYPSSICTDPILPLSNDAVTSIAIQPDGNIVLAGYSYVRNLNHSVYGDRCPEYDSYFAMTVIRYLPSGLADVFFDSIGKEKINFGRYYSFYQDSSYFESKANSLALQQNDGKIL